MIRTMALAIFQIFFSCFYAPYFNNSKYLFVCNSIQDKHQVRIISYRENSSLCNSLSLSIFVVGIHFKLRNSSHFFMYIFNKQLQIKRYVICVWHYLVKYMILLDSWTRICVNNWCCALQVILYHLKLCYSLPLFLFNSLNGQDCMCLLYSLFIHYIIWHYNHVLHFFSISELVILIYHPKLVWLLLCIFHLLKCKQITWIRSQYLKVIIQKIFVFFLTKG